ncbi:MAG: endopeptidase La [Bacilli bacterium]|nr:endopeptidase La [Bacilli bacterium]
MIKTNLPVMILRGVVLLPHNELRLEFDNDTNKDIIEVAELFHDNKLLIVCQEDYLEEVPTIEELPKIGVITSISHKLELPNGKTRIVLTGKERGFVHEYLNINHASQVLESIVSSAETDKIDSKSEEILIRKLNLELEKYIHNVSNTTNSFLTNIKKEQSLEKYTDLVAPYIPIPLNERFKFLITTSCLKRAEMLLESIYKESEIFDIEKQLDAKVKKKLDSSQKEYILREKIKTIKEDLGEISPKDDEIKEFNLKLNKLKAPKKIKERIQKELSRYEFLNSMSPEINIARSYIDCLFELPWSKQTKDNADLNNVREILDLSHAGLDDVKKRIIEYLAVQKVTKKTNGSIICLVGPPGVGKTSLASSIANAMKREFVKLSVGGFNDPAEIIGHRKSYMGAQPGRIIQSMKKAGSVNPVFLIDEIDKMTKDIKGDPASALLEVLDNDQNMHFIDNYLEEEYDLSKVMFILTANYLENIPEPLKDRLEIINLTGYTEYEKLDISKKHIIKKACHENGFDDKLLSISDDIILKLIRFYTREAGVRELTRVFESLIRKIVTENVLKGKDNQKVTIDEKLIEKHLGKAKYKDPSKVEEHLPGVVTGLAYTSVGGDTLDIEVTLYPGTGELKLTGSLGDVMKESALIALSYIKANAGKLKINENTFKNKDIHIHVPMGATPKDGPSAGITITTALISALTGKKVKSSLAMTGEMTLSGNILPIGGLKEKSIGAHRNGIKEIIIPTDNINDLDEIPTEVKADINYKNVKNYDEILKYLFIKRSKKILVSEK